MAAAMIGRKSARRSIERLLATPGGGIAVVSGPAGVGKTMLAAAVSSTLRAAGRTVVTAHGGEATQHIAFGALAAAIDEPQLSHADEAAMLRVTLDTLASRSDRGRLVLSIDDAHLLDDASLALVQLAATSRSVDLLLTVRTGEPVAASILEMWKGDAGFRVDLQPLDRSETHELIAQRCGGPVEDETAELLYEATGGNPLYASELIEAALADSTLDDAAGTWRLSAPWTVPPRLAELIGRQFDGLDDNVRSGLEVLASAEWLDLDQFVGLVGEDAVATLEQHGLVRTVDNDADAIVSLPHPIHVETLLNDTPTVRRRRARVTAAELLQRSHSTVDSARAAGLLLAAGKTVDPGTLERAARHAHSCFDMPGAERLARAALDAEPDGPSRNVMLAIVAKVLRWQGRHVDAEALFEGTGRESEVTANLALIRSENLFRGLGREDDAISLLKQGRATLDGPEADRLVAEEASFALLGGRLDDALRMAEPLLTTSPSQAKVAASIVASYAYCRSGRHVAALAAADEAVRCAEVIPGALDQDPVGPWIAATLAQIEAGSAADASEALDRGPSWVELRETPAGVPWRELLTARLCMHRGLVASAVLHARAAALAFREAGDTALERVAWSGAARAEANRGGVALDAQERAESLDPGPFTLLDVEVLWGRAWVLLAQGRAASAIEAFNDAADEANTVGQFGPEMSIRHDLLRVAPSNETISRVIELGSLVDGDLAAARVAHATALRDNDPATLLGVADRFAACEANLLAAEVATAAATLLRSDSAARAAAKAERQAALWLATCENARTPALTDASVASQLTDRELEIARLAAEGLSSAAIADRLVVSVRTVNNHLQRTYAKLGVHRRSELRDVLN